MNWWNRLFHQPFPTQTCGAGNSSVWSSGDNVTSEYSGMLTREGKRVLPAQRWIKDGGKSERPSVIEGIGVATLPYEKSGRLPLGLSSQESDQTLFLRRGSKWTLQHWVCALSGVTNIITQEGWKPVLWRRHRSYDLGIARCLWEAWAVCVVRRTYGSWGAAAQQCAAATRPKVDCVSFAAPQDGLLSGNLISISNFCF